MIATMRLIHKNGFMEELSALYLQEFLQLVGITVSDRIIYEEGFTTDRHKAGFDVDVFIGAQQKEWEKKQNTSGSLFVTSDPLKEKDWSMKSSVFLSLPSSTNLLPNLLQELIQNVWNSEEQKDLLNIAKLYSEKNEFWYLHCLKFLEQDIAIATEDDRNHLNQFKKKIFHELAIFFNSLTQEVIASTIHYDFAVLYMKYVLNWFKEYIGERSIFKPTRIFDEINALSDDKKPEFLSLQILKHKHLLIAPSIRTEEVASEPLVKAIEYAKTRAANPNPEILDSLYFQLGKYYNLRSEVYSSSQEDFKVMSLDYYQSAVALQTGYIPALLALSKIHLGTSQAESYLNELRRQVLNCHSVFFNDMMPIHRLYVYQYMLLMNDFTEIKSPGYGEHFISQAIQISKISGKFFDEFEKLTTDSSSFRKVYLLTMSFTAFRSQVLS